MDSIVIFVLILSALVAGGVGGLLTNLTLLRFYRNLEYRVYDLEDRLVREVKQRAARTGREAIEKEKKLDEWAAETAESQQPSPGLGQLPPLGEWIKRKYNRS